MLKGQQRKLWGAETSRRRQPQRRGGESTPLVAEDKRGMFAIGGTHTLIVEGREGAYSLGGSGSSGGDDGGKGD